MASLNNCQFIGNLGQDPELKYLPSGDAVASISVSTTESWKDKATGEKKEKTEWIRCEFFGKLAEIVGQYLKKGSSVYVQGRMSTREYTDKEGVKRYATSIKCDQMQMLGSKSADDSASQRAAPAAPRPAPKPAPNFSDMDSDIPFAMNIAGYSVDTESRQLTRAKQGRTSNSEF